MVGDIRDLAEPAVGGDCRSDGLKGDGSESAMPFDNTK